MSIKAFRYSLILLAATSMPALAATTQADADKLRDALKPYLGPVIDQLKITPLDDGYKASFDLSPLLAMAKDKGADVTLSPIEMIAKPAGGNKWKLHQEGDFSVAAKFSGGYVNEQLKGYSSDLLLDMDQGLITEADGTIKSMLVDEEIPDTKGNGPAKVKMAVENISYKLRAKPAAEGGADIITSYTLGQTNLIEKIPTGQAPLDVNITSTGGSFDGNITGLKGKPWLDLLRFGIANKDNTKPIDAASQAEVKAIIAAALPLFKRMESKGSLNKIVAGTPVGNFTLDKVGMGLNMNGLVKDGRFEEGFSFEGLALPPGIAPPWSTTLVPKNASFNFAVSGFDLGSWTKAAVDALDFTKDDPLPKEIQDKIIANILPQGAATISFGPSAVSNASYNLTYEGSMLAGPTAQPSGKAKITLKGFEDVMKAVNGAPPEAGLKDANAALIVAKGLAKNGADGALTWDIEANADGQVLVNGTDVKKLK